MVFILAVAMAFGICGTALAQTTVELETATSGVSRVFYGPAFGTAPGGASLFVVSGTILNGSPVTGGTLFAVSNTAANAAGLELRSQILNTGGWWKAGATPIGGPALISGTSDTVILYSMANVNVNVSGTAFAGNTLYRIDGGSGAVLWQQPIAASGFGVQVNAPGIVAANNAGGSPYCTAPIVIDNESISTSGATIYGVSSATFVGSGPNISGVSLWARDADTGAYEMTSQGVSNVTAFAVNTAGGSGISVVHAAPVISGNSLFIIGYSSAYAANTLYQFDKNNLLSGASNPRRINGNAEIGDQWVPTPAASGGSLFVVDNNGGVSVYRSADLAFQYGVAYANVTTGVTAGPVTDGTHIVLCGTSAITNYAVNTLSGNSKEWTWNFGANTEIWATPVISNNFVWVTVLNRVLATATTFRFDLRNNSTGTPTTVANHGELVYADTVAVGNDIWTVTYNPLVQKVVGAAGVQANAWWLQAKFDKARTGNNFLEEDTPIPPDDDGGTCFISTIK